MEEFLIDKIAIQFWNSELDHTEKAKIFKQTHHHGNKKRNKIKTKHYEQTIERLRFRTTKLDQKTKFSH